MIYFYLIQMKNVYYAWLQALYDKVKIKANEYTIEKVPSTHGQNQPNEQDKDKHAITITHLNYEGIKTEFKLDSVGVKAIVKFNLVKTGAILNPPHEYNNTLSKIQTHTSPYTNIMLLLHHCYIVGKYTRKTVQTHMSEISRSCYEVDKDITVIKQALVRNYNNRLIGA